MRATTFVCRSIGDKFQDAALLQISTAYRISQSLWTQEFTAGKTESQFMQNDQQKELTPCLRKGCSETPQTPRSSRTTFMSSIKHDHYFCSWYCSYQIWPAYSVAMCREVTDLQCCTRNSRQKRKTCGTTWVQLQIHQISRVSVSFFLSVPASGSEWDSSTCFAGFRASSTAWRPTVWRAAVASSAVDTPPCAWASPSRPSTSAMGPWWTRWSRASTTPRIPQHRSVAAAPVAASRRQEVTAAQGLRTRSFRTRARETTTTTWRAPSVCKCSKTETCAPRFLVPSCKMSSNTNQRAAETVKSTMKPTTVLKRSIIAGVFVGIFIDWRCCLVRVGAIVWIAFSPVFVFLANVHAENEIIFKSFCLTLRHKLSQRRFHGHFCLREVSVRFKVLWQCTCNSTQLVVQYKILLMKKYFGLRQHRNHLFFETDIFMHLRFLLFHCLFSKQNKCCPLHSVHKLCVGCQLDRLRSVRGEQKQKFTAVKSLYKLSHVAVRVHEYIVFLVSQPALRFIWLTNAQSVVCSHPVKSATRQLKLRFRAAE